MTNKQMLQTDLEILEKSLQFHKDRISTFGQPRANKKVYPFDSVNPDVLIPHLESNIKALKAEIAKGKKG